MPGTNFINQVGKREDLADIIAVVDAAEMPATSALRKGRKPTNSLFEWQVDSFDASNPQPIVDGTDVSAYEDAAANRARLGNYVQIFRRTPKVTRLAEYVADVAGVNNPDPNGVRGGTEFARAKAKKIVELKRDIETAILSTNEAQADTGAVGFQTRGLGKWIQNSAQSVLPVPSAFRTPTASVYSSTMAAFTEDSLRTLLQSRWSQTKMKGTLIGIVGPDVRNAITDFIRYSPNKDSNTVVRQFNTSAESGKVTSTVDIYNGDYGTVELFTSAFVPTTKTGYLIDADYAELRSHTAPYYQDLPDLGGGPRGIVEAIVGLAVLNPLAHCKIVAS